jgi:beta-glucosidase
MLAVGARHALAPVLDVARDPRWGRVEETYGEDPVLVGAMGTAFVSGLQTDDLRDGVAATGKHFLAHGMPEGGRNHAPVHFGPRELRDVYAEPFAAVIREAGLASVMNSYSSVDGLPCAGSREILSDLLRGELGFDGIVVADYFAVALLARHHRTAADKQEAARQALLAGMDMELPAVDCFGDPLLQDVLDGRTPMSAVDTAVGRVLAYKERLGVFDSTAFDPSKADLVFDTPAQRLLARRAATESIVLLANSGILPLPAGLGCLAVIGPGADDRRLLQGDYHYPAHQEMLYEETTAPEGGDLDLLPVNVRSRMIEPHYTDHVTPLAGLRKAVGEQTEVLYERGCDVAGDDRSGIPAAVAVAKQADVAVVVVAGRSGLRPSSTVGEARDATDLRLTGVQEELVREVAATSTPTVVVVLSGRVHELTGVAEVADALLQVWPPGEEGGNAVADVVFGHVNPSGRLPVTMPRTVGQIPVHGGHRAGGNRSEFFGDYTDSPASPLYHFGHGLSYTTFAYDGLSVLAATTGDEIVAEVAVANSGERAGQEVVQLYVSDLVASVARPDRELVGFAKLDLQPGERCLVSFVVHPSRLAFRDESLRLVVEPGAYRFAVGSSSNDVRCFCDVSLRGEVTEWSPKTVVATTVSAEKTEGHG